MAVLAFLMLIAGLVLFLVSTKQWALWIRGVIWAGGLFTLLVAAMLTFNDEGHSGGLLRAFGDLLAHWYAPGESILAQSLAHNGPSVGRFVLPLLDLFLILGFIVGIVALVAFTPGDTLEKVLRPINIALVGAIIGGVVALGIVGTGFGEVSQQAAYSNYIARDDVADGDTLWIGQASVRLRGVDAPELGQTCRLGNQPQDCGAAARKHLQDIIAGALVTCVREAGEDRTEGNFRRPLVLCNASRSGDAPFDIGQRMIADGYAVEYRGEAGAYAGEAAEAMRVNSGLLASCTLRPDVWRRLDDAGQQRFAASGRRVRDAAIMGHCPPAPREPGASERREQYVAPE